VVFALINRFSWRSICAAGALLSAAGFMVSTTVTDIKLLYAAWFIAGLGAGLPFSIAIQTLAELGNQERVMGLKLTAEVLLGAALLYLFPVLLIAHWQYDGAAFGIAIALLLGLPVIRKIPSTHRTQRPRQTGDRAIPWTENLPAIIALATLAIFFAGQAGVWAFVERIGKEIGVAGGEMGFVLAIVKVLGGVGGATAALVGARFGARWPHLVGVTCIGYGLYLIHTASTLWPYAIGTWVWEFGFALSQCYQMAAVARLDRSRRMLVLVPAGLGVGAAFGPAVAGALKTGESYLPIFLFATACAVLATIVFSILMSPKRWQSTTESVSTEAA
jgi:predicted MFS family arabinose efflux permease